MKKPMVRLLFFAVVAGLALSAGGGVNAEAGSNLCPANRACLYADKGWVNLLGYRSGGLGYVNVSAAADNKMTSYENKTASHARWYHGPNESEKCVSMHSGTEDNEVSWNDNDKLTSWATNGACR